MLSVITYSQDYVDECRSRMEAQLKAYNKLVSVTDKNNASFDTLFFNNLILVLDHYFVHRLRAKEKKDGNPLNEVRMLSHSILRSEGIMCPDPAIKYKPENSVLKLQIGQKIRLNATQFQLIFRAYFTEIQNKFT